MSDEQEATLVGTDVASEASEPIVSSRFRVRVSESGHRALMNVRMDGTIEIADDLTLDEARFCITEMARAYMTLLARDREPSS